VEEIPQVYQNIISGIHCLPSFLEKAKSAMSVISRKSVFASGLDKDLPSTSPLEKLWLCT